MDRLKFRAYSLKEKLMISYDTLTQTAFNLVKEEGNKFERYGLLYVVSTSPDFIKMLCTGRKDLNSKLIYEGDILEIVIFYFDGSEAELHFRAIVGYNDQDAMFELKIIGGEDFAEFQRENTPNVFNFSDIQDTESGTEIIGNIHENPELLEAKC